MEDKTVTLAAIGLVGTVVACLIWVVKYFANTLSKDLKEHTAAALKQAQASKEQTQASKEVLLFMKNLNGKLEGAFVEKVKEKSAQREN